MDKGCKVEGWVAVEGQLVTDQLIGCLRIYALCITVDEELRKDVSGVIEAPTLDGILYLGMGSVP